MVVRKEKDGTFTVDLSHGKNPVTGKRIRIIKRNLTTRKEAVNLESYLRMVELADKKRDDVVTVDMLYGLLKKEDEQNSRKVSYRSTQEGNYYRHIRPYFLKADMAKVTYDHVYRFRESLKFKPTQQDKHKLLSFNTINKIMILLGKLFEAGLRRNLIQDNPTQHLKKLSIKKQKLIIGLLRNLSSLYLLFIKMSININCFLL